jgi:hypothetical protein
MVHDFLARLCYSGARMFCKLGPCIDTTDLNARNSLTFGVWNEMLAPHPVYSQEMGPTRPFVVDGRSNYTITRSFTAVTTSHFHQENAPLAIWRVCHKFSPTWTFLDRITLIASIASLWIPPLNYLQLGGKLPYITFHLPLVSRQLLAG